MIHILILKTAKLLQSFEWVTIETNRRGTIYSYVFYFYKIYIILQINNALNKKKKNGGVHSSLKVYYYPHYIAPTSVFVFPSIQ